MTDTIALYGTDGELIYFVNSIQQGNSLAIERGFGGADLDTANGHRKLVCYPCPLEGFKL